MKPRTIKIIRNILTIAFFVGLFVMASIDILSIVDFVVLAIGIAALMLTIEVEKTETK